MKDCVDLLVAEALADVNLCSIGLRSCNINCMRCLQITEQEENKSSTRTAFVRQENKAGGAPDNGNLKNTTEVRLQCYYVTAVIVRQ